MFTFIKWLRPSQREIKAQGSRHQFRWRRAQVSLWLPQGRFWATRNPSLDLGHGRGNFGVLETKSGLGSSARKPLTGRSWWGFSKWSVLVTQGAKSSVCRGVLTVREEGKIRKKFPFWVCVFGCIHRAPSPVIRQCWLELGFGHYRK